MPKPASVAKYPMVFLALALLISGCRNTAPVVDGSVSPASGIVLNDSRLEAELPGSVADVERRARAVLTEMGMQITRVQTEDDIMRAYQAYGGDRIVELTIQRGEAGRTKISVASMRVSEGRLTMVQHDTQYARTVIERIQQPT